MAKRIWWQRPQLRTDEENHRHRRVGWLELFFDLVFVVVISELAHTLAEDVSWSGVGTFILLFLPVWWMWIGATYYNERFETEGLENRLFFFLQMLPVAGLAVFAHHGLSETSVGYGLSYAAGRIIVTFLWFWGGYHDRRFRPVAKVYVPMFITSIALFLWSVVVPPPGRFVFWGIGLLLDMTAPFFTMRYQATLPRLSSSKLPERFGLFIIIALGESIIGVVHGLAEQKSLTLVTGLTGALGMFLAFGVWWIYFDFVGRRPPKPVLGWSIAWAYLHLPLVMTIAATGAGILNVITQKDPVLPNNIRLLIAGSLGLSLAIMALLELTLRRDPDEPTHPQLSPTLKLGGAAGALLLGLLGQGLGAIALLLLLILLEGVQMGYGFYVWFNQTIESDSDVDGLDLADEE